MGARLCRYKQPGSSTDVEEFSSPSSFGSAAEIIDDPYLLDGEHALAHRPHVLAPAGDNNAHGLVVLFFALRDFKAINTRFGHDAGDDILVEVAQRLNRSVRETDTVARYGGDEFVVLADGFSLSDAHSTAVWIQSQIHLPILCGNEIVRMHAGAGIAWAECGTDPGEILRAARRAAS